MLDQIVEYKVSGVISSMLPELLLCAAVGGIAVKELWVVCPKLLLQASQVTDGLLVYIISLFLPGCLVGVAGMTVKATEFQVGICVVPSQ